MLVLLLCGDGYAADKSANLSVVAQATSEWTYHGVSETAGEPSIGVNAEWQALPRLFLGVEAHQSSVNRVRQRQGSIMAYLGTSGKLGSLWYGTLSFQHREFPGSTREWDFSELQAEIAHRNGVTARFSYSPDYYEHRTTAFNTEVAYARDFHQHAYWFVQLGALELSEPLFTDYRHARFGAGLSIRSANLELAYAWTSARSMESFGGAPIDSPGLLLSLSYRVR